MEWWQAVILGLVEGITEYLPVSSTGHLIIAAALLGLDEPGVKRSVDAFNIVIQGGAILAVLGLYWPRVVGMVRGLAGRDAAGLRLLINLAVAFLPAAVFGVLLDDWIEAKLFFPGPVVTALMLGGVYMLVVDAWWRGRRGAGTGTEIAPRVETDPGLGVDDLTPRKALVIGCMQCVAMWPGMSRSMMSITGGMLVGLRPAAAAEFSFLLGLPTLGAACLYTLVKNLAGESENGTPGNLFEQLDVAPVVIGLVVATVSAAVAVKWLVAFLNRRGLAVFGWYRLALGLALLGLILGGRVRIEATPETVLVPMDVPAVEGPKIPRGTPEAR